MVPLPVCARICRMRVLHVLLPFLQVKLRQKGALLNKTRGFYSGVNGNRRANIPLGSERGEDPVPTTIISVTNREHRELFHYIMRHYIVLEKTVFDDMRRIGKCISGNPPFFLQGFQPMFIMLRII